MELLTSIDYEVTERTPEVEELIEELVADEARTFVANLQRRLVHAGLEDVQVSVRESA